MSGYTKLFSSILGSTIWQETKDTKILWVTMLALVDKDGVVEATIPGLAHFAGLTVGETLASLAVLESPDSFSRSPENEGRRCQRIEGGWMLTNHAKYRDMQDPEVRREYLRQKKAESRARQATTNTTGVATAPNRSNYERSGVVFFVATKDRVKISLSTNPWARLGEIRRLHPEAEIVGMESGTNVTENQRHERFADLNIQDDWYRKDQAILDFARSLPGAKRQPPAATTIRSTKSTHTDTEADTDAVKDSSLRELSAPAGCDESSGFSPEELATYERERAQAEDHPTLALENEDVRAQAKGFPWPQVHAIFKRIAPEIGLPDHASKRDNVMKNFWRARGKSAGIFEVLATRVHASDFLMARNGHKGRNDRPYPWSWVFSKDDDGRLRADRILEGAYDNEKMAFVLEKAAKAAQPKLTKVIFSDLSIREVNMAEVHNGKPRYKLTGETVSGLPDAVDYLNA